MLSSPEILTIKAAQRRLVMASGGQEACAAVPGMRLKRHQSFNDFGNALLADRHMPIDVVATLERFGGSMEVTRCLADLNSCLLVPLPHGGGQSVLAEATGRTAKEIGDVMVRIGEALRDGKIDASEGASILAEIHEAMVWLAALAEAVSNIASEGEADEQ